MNFLKKEYKFVLGLISFITILSFCLLYPIKLEQDIIKDINEKHKIKVNLCESKDGILVLNQCINKEVIIKL